MKTHRSSSTPKEKTFEDLGRLIGGVLAIAARHPPVDEAGASACAVALDDLRRQVQAAGFPLEHALFLDQVRIGMLGIVMPQASIDYGTR